MTHNISPAAQQADSSGSSGELKRRGKTRDAFALRWLYDEIIKMKEIRDAVDPNDDFAELVQGNWMVPLDKYLDKHAPKKIKPFPCPLPRPHSNSLWMVIRTLQGEEAIERILTVTKPITAHVARLKRYSGIVFDCVLSEGLTADLKAKGDRVKKLTAQYSRILVEFDEYKSCMDRSEFEGEEFIFESRKEFGRRLKQARKAKRMTAAEMAFKLGMSRVGYGFYERGQRDLPTPTIIKLAVILDVSLDWLFGLTDEK